MALDVQGISLTDDHTLESASEVMSALRFDRRLPNGRQSYMKLLRDFGFQSDQYGEHNQFVFQGQCLILGDPKVGKTSLKNSLMGKQLNTEEPGTKGVEVSLVDRTWRNLDAEGLAFGSFARYGTSALWKIAMFGPAGMQYIADLECTPTMSKLANILFIFLRMSWIISLIWLLAFGTVSAPVGFYVSSFATFSVAYFLHSRPTDNQPGYKLLLLVANLPFFMIGFQARTYILTKNLKRIERYNVFAKNACYSALGNQCIWEAHLLIFTLLFTEISIDLVVLVAEHFDILSKGSDSEETLVPGQVKFIKNPVPILRGMFIFIIPVVSGVCCGCLLTLSTKLPTFDCCNLTYFFVIPVFAVVLLTMHRLYTSGNLFRSLTVLFIYIVMDNNKTNLPSFCPTLYMGMLFLYSFYSLYKTWEMVLPFNYAKETQTSFTIIFMEKVKLNFQKLKTALHWKFSSLKLNLVDFSGDKDPAYHHIFMRDQAMYIVVFDMENFVDNNFENTEMKTQRIRFWLKFICGKAIPSTPVFLVGTHRGRMDQTYLERIDKHLQEQLFDAFSNELVVNKEDNLMYFPTENSLSRKDKGIQNLQKEIISKAEEHKSTLGKVIPYSWIKIQDAIINLRKKKKAKFCITLKQLPVSVGNFICSNWSKDTIRYFHKKGLVIYVDQGEDSELSEWILLKPDILVDVIIKLLNPPTDKKILQPKSDWKLLHDNGMLTKSLLEEILSTFQEDGKALQLFLEEYDIICPLFHDVVNQVEEARVTHFVPALLPISSNAKTPVWLDEPDDKKFYVFFDRFLPEPLFQHLLIRAHRHSKSEFPREQPVICRDAGRFWLQPNPKWTPVPYRLLQLKNQDMIEVTFNCRGKSMMPSDVLCLIFGMVDGICKKYFPNVKFHCGPACLSEQCPGYQGDYKSHPGVQQSCSQRRHVFNVLPAHRQHDVVFFHCVNQNFQEQLMEWVENLPTKFILNQQNIHVH